jgi:hypothetical protein
VRPSVSAVPELSRSLFSDANAIVTRISLFCKIAAPVAFSLVMAFTSRSTRSSSSSSSASS